MSKGKRQQNVDAPEEQQHDPITVPEPVGEATRAGGVLAQPTLPPRFADPTPAAEVRTMVAAQPAKAVNFEQRVYRCVYDDAATARKVTIGERDPDVFCQVCGNRMVREG